MGELERARVAELIVDTGLQSARRGSGYRVSTGVVLTAAHVIRGSTSVLVRFNADRDDEWTSPGAVAFVDDGCDIGVVTLVDPPSGGITSVEYGRLAERSAVVPYEAVGFPRFKLRNDPLTATSQQGAETSRYRDAAHVHGMIASLANWREGTLELVVDPPGRDPDPAHSPWEGMSGAAVWCAGRIVGVVSEHHRSDGLNRLAAIPFVTAQRDLRIRWAELARLLAMPLDAIRLADVVAPSLGTAIGEGYLAQVEDIAPGQLVGRDPELDMLTRFCAGEEPYQWWQAGPWHGKTALASWLVLHPPVGVRVVAFFITGRLAGQSDHTAYTRAMVEQLAVLTRDAALLGENIADWDGQRIRLLKKAAQRAESAGERLLVVVDGLDEDRGAPPAGRTSIASLLPRRPPDAVRVLVMSRPHPGIPNDVSGDHPLRRCRIERLRRSDEARELELAAKHELSEHLANGDPAPIDILGLLTAAGGGLTVSELAELTDRPRWEIGQLTGGAFGRSLTSRAASTLDPPDSEPVLIFGHEALREQAQRELGRDVRKYRTRIDTWVAEYRDSGWPEGSPRFVFRPYARLLRSTGEARLLVALGTDRLRHDRMFQQTFGDANALEEVVDAQNALIEMPAPRDLASLIVLALERHRLTSRGASIPSNLPAVWATLGNLPRAVALARSIDVDDRQARALTAVATALANTGRPDDAERIARSLINDLQQVRALTAVATALANTGRPDDAERIARSLINDLQQVRALTAVATALANTGRPDDAERIARSLINDLQQVQALTAVATALADTGNPQQAHGIALDAERIARSLTNNDQQAEALTAVAAALANTGHPDHAERIARSLTNEDQQADALTDVAAALAKTGHRDDAEQMARSLTNRKLQGKVLTAVVTALANTGHPDHAERIARSLPRNYQQAPALTEVVIALANTGHPDHAERIARSLPRNYQQAYALTAVATALANTGHPDHAERIARSLPRNYQQAYALTAVATALVNTGHPKQAHRVALDAEHIARSLTDDDQQVRALTDVAAALANTGHPEQAHRIARILPKSRQQVRALTDVAAALANTGHPEEAHRIALDAEHIARSLTNEDQQVRALTDVATALANTGHPEQAHRIALDAEHIARSLTNEDQKAAVLTAVATTLANTGHPEQAHRIALDAEHIARSLTNEDQKAAVLTAVATTLANTGHPEQAHRIALDAEHIARSLTNEDQKAAVLTAVATAVAQTGHCDDAERIARSLADAYARAEALTDVATALANTGHIDDAERVARSLLRKYQQARALSDVANALADAGHLERAHRIALDAEHIARSVASTSLQAAVLTAVSGALAKTGDPRGAHRTALDAEHIARGLADVNLQVNALVGLAQIMANTGHRDDAERVGISVLTTKGWAACVGTVASLLLLREGEIDLLRRLAAWMPI